MADPLLRIRRSRGLNSLIKGEKQLDNAMRDALKKDFVPLIEKEFSTYVDNWDDPPFFKVNMQVGPQRGQVVTVKVRGSRWAVDRWDMVDSKGRKGGKIVESKKFKTTRRKGEVTKTRKFGVGGEVSRTVKQTKGGTYQRQVPFPIRLTRFAKTNQYGHVLKHTKGDGKYEEPPIFRTKYKLGDVTPGHITRDHIAPVMRKEMTRVVENAYRRAFLAIIGRGI